MLTAGAFCGIISLSGSPGNTPGPVVVPVVYTVRVLWIGAEPVHGAVCITDGELSTEPGVLSYRHCSGPYEYASFLVGFIVLLSGAGAGYCHVRPD